MSYEAYCQCSAFTYWYTDTEDDEPPIAVCWCGHSASEHLDGVRSCVGLVEVYPAEAVGTEERHGA